MDIRISRSCCGYPVAVADQGFNGSPESCGSWHHGCNRVPHQQDRQTIFFWDAKSSEFFGQVSQPGFGLYIHLYETIDMYWTFMMHADNTLFSSPVTTTLRQMSATPWGPWTHLLCYMIGILFLLSRQDLRLLNKKPPQTCPTDNLEAMKKNQWNVDHLGRKLKSPHLFALPGYLCYERKTVQVYWWREML